MERPVYLHRRIIAELRSYIYLNCKAEELPYINPGNIGNFFSQKSDGVSDQLD
jgi:hypothetical protein